MSPNRISRIAAVLIGAAVIFGLEQGLGAQWYIAIPAGVLAYGATLMTLGRMLGTGTRPK